MPFPLCPFLYSQILPLQKLICQMNIYFVFGGFGFGIGVRGPPPGGGLGRGVRGRGMGILWVVLYGMERLTGAGAMSEVLLRG
jgi:hypothetical protein